MSRKTANELHAITMGILELHNAMGTQPPKPKVKVTIQKEVQSWDAWVYHVVTMTREFPTLLPPAYWAARVHDLELQNRLADLYEKWEKENGTNP